MKNLQFTVIMLFLLAGFNAKAQKYSTLSLLDLQKRMTVNSPVNNRSATTTRSFILLDSIRCKLTHPFGEDPLEDTYFEYNDEHQLLKDSVFTWDLDAISGEYVRFPALKQYYTYTPTGEVHTITQLGWDRDKDEWSIDTLRLEYFYVDNKLLRIAHDFYDSEANEWVTDVFESFQYDGDILMGIIVGFYDDQNVFVPIARVDYTYEEDLLIKEAYYFTFDGGEEWIELFYTEIENVLSRPVGTFTYFYDEEVEDYVPLEATHSIYNEHDLIDATITFLWLDEWVSFRNCTYYYTEDQVSAIDEKQKPLSELHMSNPFQGGTVIAPALEEMGTYIIDLIDIYGKTVQSHSGLGNTWTLSAPEKPGMYLVIVRQNNLVVANRKIITTSTH